MSFTKILYIVTSNDVMHSCMKLTYAYQNKMATTQSNNTKTDEMKILFNCGAGVDSKDKR